MPVTTEKQYVIGVTQTSGTAAQTDFSFVNARTGDIFRRRTVSNEVSANLGNEKEWPNGFKNNDVIDLTGTGLKTGNTSVTVDTSKGGTKVRITMVDASTTNAPAVSI